MAQSKPPQDVIAEALEAQPVADHGTYLRSILAYAAAGLLAIEGKQSAYKAVDKLAEAIFWGQPS